MAGRYYGSKAEDLKASSSVDTFEPQLDGSKNDHKGRHKLVKSLKNKKEWTDKVERRMKKNDWKNEKLEPIPVPEEKLDKYYRDEPVDLEMVKTKQGKAVLKGKEDKFQSALRLTAKSEMMLIENAGGIEMEENESLSSLSQHQILKQVDVLSKQKCFDLKLDKFGPYRVNYTRNGRYLAFAGALGHVACFDWFQKKLLCEVNVRERCRDIVFLHQETMFAVAQKRLYIYDNQGIELHCINQMDNVERLEFLPYHFLLVGGVCLFVYFNLFLFITK